MYKYLNAVEYTEGIVGHGGHHFHVESGQRKRHFMNRYIHLATSAVFSIISCTSLEITKIALMNVDLFSPDAYTAVLGKMKKTSVSIVARFK